jgi:hypothetical protein
MAWCCWSAVRTLASGSKFAADDLFRLTGGNPFYVNEVVSAGTDEIPATARDAILARTARLSAPASDVLDVAALTGSKVEVDLLRAVTACGPADLDELVASGLVVGDGRWLRFRHEIARLAVAQAVAAHRSGPIHAKVLQAMVAQGSEDDAGLAYHAEAAGDRESVLRFAPRAARCAAELASHREAAAQYKRALRFAAEADVRERAATRAHSRTGQGVRQPGQRAAFRRRQRRGDQPGQAGSGDRRAARRHRDPQRRPRHLGVRADRTGQRLHGVAGASAGYSHRWPARRTGRPCVHEPLHDVHLPQAL